MNPRIVFPLLILSTYLISGVVMGAEWSGADDLAMQKIHEITGGEYRPWMRPLWEPPSGEIETFLFSLQSAIGALIIGYFLGYYRGLKKTGG